MLVLIVVVAASAFAVFVAEKQEKIQRQDRIETEKELEEIRISKVTPDPDGTSSGNSWDDIAITFASVHMDRSVISSITINDVVVEQFTFEEGGSWAATKTPYTISGNEFYLEAMEQARILIDLATDNDFFGSAPTIEKADFIKVEIFTKRTNDFSRSFLPPSSIPLLKTESIPSGGSFEDKYVLDGSQSDQPGDDAYIVFWEWSVIHDNDNGGAGDGDFDTSGGDPDQETTATGRKVVLDLSGVSGTLSGMDHQVTLTVTNNYGMISEAYIVFTS